VQRFITGVDTQAGGGSRRKLTVVYPRRRRDVACQPVTGGKTVTDSSLGAVHGAGEMQGGVAADGAVETGGDHAIHAGILGAAGEVDLKAADTLERVLDLARDHGLLVQLVLAYHGEFLEGWSESPYAASNGGPCSVNAEFFTHYRARRAFRNFCRYVAARFAAHEALFAWELFNEADLVPVLTPGDVLHWHRSMARSLRSHDPSRRPITTSVARAGSARQVEELPEIVAT